MSEFKIQQIMPAPPGYQVVEAQVHDHENFAYKMKKGSAEWLQAIAIETTLHPCVGLALVIYDDGNTGIEPLYIDDGLVTVADTNHSSWRSSYALLEPGQEVPQARWFSTSNGNGFLSARGHE